MKKRKIIVLTEDGYDRDSAEVFYKIGNWSPDDLRKEFYDQQKLPGSFVGWLVEKGYCANIHDEQIEYFYY